MNRKSKKEKRLITLKEIDMVLLSTCNKCEAKEIAVNDECCKTCNASCVLKLLGLDLNNGKAFNTISKQSPEEDEKMIELFKSHTMAQVAEIMDTTAHAVRNRINFLRKKGVKIENKHDKKFHFWNEKNDALLVELYEENTMEETAKTLGISKGAAESRIHILRKRGVAINKKEKRGNKSELRKTV